MADKAEKAAVIISAVEISADMTCYIGEGDYIVACDAGYKNAERLGLVPDLIVGDFDSAPQPAGIDGKTIVLPHIKDDTDTFYAARWLLQHSYTQITMLGATGGRRIEHTIANIATALYLAKNGAQVCMADEYSELRILLPGKDLCLERGDWKYISLFPLDGDLTGVKEEGVFYELHGAVLHPDSSLGVSNEFTAPQAVIGCTGGSGLVILSRADA